MNDSNYRGEVSNDSVIPTTQKAGGGLRLAVRLCPLPSRVAASWEVASPIQAGYRTGRRPCHGLTE